MPSVWRAGFNTFVSRVLTTQFIRTVTEVRPEWLLEYAPKYFDPETFPKESETRRALQRVIAKVSLSDNCLPYLELFAAGDLMSETFITEAGEAEKGSDRAGRNRSAVSGCWSVGTRMGLTSASGAPEDVES